MFTILIRTILIYLFLIGIMRLMGKRQLGELEVTDLVITLLLSEIATIPITDKNTPILYAIVPVITLASFEVFTSGLSLKYPRIKSLLSPKPALLIRFMLVAIEAAETPIDSASCFWEHSPLSSR